MRYKPGIKVRLLIDLSREYSGFDDLKAGTILTVDISSSSLVRFVGINGTYSVDLFTDKIEDDLYYFVKEGCNLCSKEETLLR
tara:strand:+ start:1311 stop:1559 length:249 start_codon:yes stop_codon:yes gene_type:complete